MKRVIFILAASLLATACGGVKEIVQQQQQDTEVLVPCSGSEYQSDNEYFRANAMGLSTDMSIAKKKALSDARAELATQVSATIQRVIDDYTSSYQSGENDEAKRRYQDMARTVVNEKVSGSRIICEKTMKTPDAKYKVYVAVQFSAEEVLKAVSNRLANDEKLRTDFEYEKFKKTFNEEMEKNKAE